MATYHLRLKKDNKGGKKVSAKGHADYILREGENEQTDCVFKGKQLPSWADGSPQKFFSAATRYEDKGNSRYKELELSLPNELTVEQNQEIVETFIEHHLKNHYYAYGIHEKAGAVSGEKHPHVHIMFSERLIDEVEREKERPAYKYFKRAAKPLKGEKELSLERRREHGAPKDKKWHDKKYLIEIREDFAQIQNKILEKYGYSIRVDSRSLEAQQQEAEEKGDTFLAKLNLRVPEAYIGVKKARQRKIQRLESLFQIDIDKTTTTEFEVKEKVRRAEVAAQNFSSTFAADIAKLNSLKRKLTTTKQAIEKAQEEYLKASELKIFRDYKESLREKYNLEKLKEELKVPPDYQIKNLDAYEEIIEAIENRITTIRKSLKFKEVEELEEKLKNASTYQNIALVAHQRFQQNLEILEEMGKLSEGILNKCRGFEEKSEKEVQEVFSLSELKDNLRYQYSSLKKAKETTESKIFEIGKKVIRPSRALFIAKNVFLKGELKKLKMEKRKCEKAVKKLELDLESFQKENFNFENTGENLAEKFQQHYCLVKRKIELESRQEENKKWKNSLDDELQRLENFCTREETKEEIAIIAASILRKNLSVVQAFEKEKKKLADIKQNLQLCKDRLNFISAHKSKKNYFYKIIPSGNLAQKDQNLIMSVIADAIRGENYAVSLVARSSSNNLEMDKNWELMSELDKDELIHKQIFRDL